MKIGVVIPVKNCLDYTRGMYETLVSKHELVKIIVDDFPNDGTKVWLHEHPEIISIINPSQSKGVASNWNIGIKRAFEEGCKYVLVANNDVIFNKKTIDNLVTRMEIGDVVMATGANINTIPPEQMFEAEIQSDTESEHPDFACFMISQKTIDEVGWFDESFERAYFEDNDYHARLILSGNRAVKTNKAQYYHFASKTSNQSLDIVNMVQRFFGQNQAYFVQKWGTNAVSEPSQMREMYFKTPFNRGGSIKE